MSIGQEGDTRKFRRLKKTDYYVAKAAAEQKEVTNFDRCLICGEEIREGKSYGGLCIHCWNET